MLFYISNFKILIIKKNKNTQNLYKILFLINKNKFTILNFTKYKTLKVLIS